MDSILVDEQNETVQKLDRRIWWRILPFLRPYRREMMLAGFCLVFLGAHDVAMTYLAKFIIDRYIVPGSTEHLGSFVLLYLALTAGMGLTVYQFIRIAGLLEAGISCDIRQAGFEKLQELSKGYFDRQPAGRIVARLTSDTVKLGEFISWGLVDMVWGFTMMIGVVAVMFFVNARLAAITLTVVPVLALASWFFQKKIVEMQRLVRQLNGRITGAINEGILGAKTTKTLAVEDKVMDDFTQLTGQMRQRSIRSAWYSALFQPVVINIGAVGTVLALTVGGQQVLNGVITYGTLVLFINYSVQFFEPIREMARILAEMQSAQASAERILDLLDTQPEVSDSPDVVREFGTLLQPNRQAFEALRGDIALEKVSFYYKKEEPVFQDLDLAVAAGTSVALVGSTGSGKSTLASLICRFYEPQSGRVLLDGKDIRQRSMAWLHGRVVYVQQTPHLFRGTIRENIRYGRLEASDSDIEEAARKIGLHDAIEHFPNGYDTEVGEGGSMLSMGQKQMVAFVRAVISDPAVLILDEATSNLDTVSENMIQQALAKVIHGRTSLIIAHRLSTIRGCDRILVMEKGTIVEDGTHATLLKLRQRYWSLYTQQYLEEQENELLGTRRRDPYD